AFFVKPKAATRPAGQSRSAPRRRLVRVMLRARVQQAMGNRSPGISQSSLDKRVAGAFDAKATRSTVRRRTVPGITDNEARSRSVGNTQARRFVRPTAAIR